VTKKRDVNDYIFVHNTVATLPCVTCEMQKSYFGHLQQ